MNKEKEAKIKKIKNRTNQILQRLSYEDLDPEQRKRLENEVIEINSGMILKFLNENIEQHFQNDAFACGLYGLAKAVRTFKFDKMNEFSTYAFACVRNEILLNYHNVTGVPRHLYEKLEKGRNSLKEKGNYLPSMSEILTESGVKKEEYNAVFSLISLDKKINKNGEESSTYADLIPSRELNQIDVAIKDEMIDALKQEIEKLTPEEQQLITGRFYEEKCFKKIGEDAGISRAYASRKIDHICKNLRNKLEKQGYDSSDFDREK